MNIEYNLRSFDLRQPRSKNLKIGHGMHVYDVVRVLAMHFVEEPGRVHQEFEKSGGEVKLASLVPASASFLRGDIASAQKSIVVKIDKETERFVKLADDTAMKKEKEIMEF